MNVQIAEILVLDDAVDGSRVYRPSTDPFFHPGFP